jgi:hypothetical protein
MREVKGVRTIVANGASSPATEVVVLDVELVDSDGNRERFRGAFIVLDQEQTAATGQPEMDLIIGLPHLIGKLSTMFIRCFRKATTDAHAAGWEDALFAMHEDEEESTADGDDSTNPAAFLTVILNSMSPEEQAKERERMLIERERTRTPAYIAESEERWRRSGVSRALREAEAITADPSRGGYSSESLSPGEQDQLTHLLEVSAHFTDHSIDQLKHDPDYAAQARGMIKIYKDATTTLGNATLSINRLAQLRLNDRGEVHAVRVGRNPGFYQSDTESRAQYERYSGAQHKKFNNLEAARAYMMHEPPTPVMSGARNTHTPILTAQAAPTPVKTDTTAQGQTSDTWCREQGCRYSEVYAEEAASTRRSMRTVASNLHATQHTAPGDTAQIEYCGYCLNPIPTHQENRSLTCTGASNWGNACGAAEYTYVKDMAEYVLKDNVRCARDAKAMLKRQVHDAVFSVPLGAYTGFHHVYINLILSRETMVDVPLAEGMTLRETHTWATNVRSFWHHVTRSYPIPPIPAAAPLPSKEKEEEKAGVFAMKAEHDGTRYDDAGIPYDDGNGPDSSSGDEKDVYTGDKVKCPYRWSKEE